MKNGNSSNQFIKGALLLTIAGLVSKILSAGYRIPLQNITGNEGFYVYQQVYPILGIAWMLSLYGLPAALSSLVAEQTIKDKYRNGGTVFLPVFLAMMLLSLLGFLVVYFGSSALARFIGDPSLTPIYKLASFTFLFLPFTSVLRGWFQGDGDMKPTAISQVVEQLVRVVVILFAAVVLVGEDVYLIGSGAAYGSIAGALAAIITLVYFRVKHRNKALVRMEGLAWSRVLYTVFVVGVFTCFNYMTLLFMQLADALNLVNALESAGMSFEAAKEWKGIFDRGYPLLQLGLVLGSSLALALIPALTKQRLAKNEEQTILHTKQALSLSFYLSLGATIGLILMFPQVNVLFFETDEGTTALRVLSLAILFGSVGLTSSALLQGLGTTLLPAAIVLIAFVLKCVGNSIAVPLWGITGAAVSSTGAMAIICIANLVALRTKLKRSLPIMNLRLIGIVFVAVLALVVSVHTSLFLYREMFPVKQRLDYIGYTFVPVLVGALTYIIALIRGGAFTDELLEQFPLQSLISKLKK
ncbi:polysaccharide biosynthesis protein [Pontibacillus halophilus JSM 076056 = DSM 19796]|uniref:Polysaccharide biosynthesis protein n=1 Tax=Pontibacillus halophilus JSM 076056 = DSM 19796 TaxID=1385510 RepID=A0A0A5I2K7_9BACI|nr:polysaccharide biosynthesis protein [Pontibacillus halophilus]KGX90077.1 polysaccharide biosynthesis protein [Pontibacillus halophilus JSM 076056 = DSM 19796]